MASASRLSTPTAFGSLDAEQARRDTELALSLCVYAFCSAGTL